MRPFTNLVGAVVEAWAELRINRTRVLLSLIGVAIAVAAITTVVGAGALVSQQQTESMERSSGRPAMLSISVATPDQGTTAPLDLIQPAYEAAIARYHVKFAARSTYVNPRVQLPTGVTQVYGMAMDPDYGTMHRVRLAQGRWFTAADDRLLAPPVLINEAYWRLLGSPPLATHPTITLVGETDVTAVVIGITPAPSLDELPSISMLFSTWLTMTPPAEQEQNGASFELWVPPALADQLTTLLRRDIAGDFDGYVTSVNRNDYLAYSTGDPLLGVKIAISIIAGLVLLLGALGLVNISLVTVRQRIREIGIRRSFGATAGRVFFSVMMESIVATVAAGFIGVAVAIAVVQNPTVQEKLGGGVIDVPPFPIEAAVIGLLASAAVGALAGLLPAIVAVRVKVIDAIRY